MAKRRLIGIGKVSWLLIMGVLLVIADQLSKFFVRQNLSLGEMVPIARGFLYLTFTKNTGAVFGSLQNTNGFLIWATLIAVGLILYLWDQFPNNRLSHICLMLVLAGTLGNLIDRIFLGYVTDFVDVMVWPVFNLADSMVTIGISVLMVMLIRDGVLAQKKMGKRGNNKRK